ncbi:MAG: hypothetical protein R6X23_04175 [Acidimicrobiia bacterium]
MFSRRSVISVSLAAVLALFASPVGATVAGAKNGCKYLKVGEVNEITGLTFVKGAKPPGPAVIAACGYTLPDDPTTSVNVWVQRGSSAATGFTTAKEAFAADAETVSGLGKKAFYAGGVSTVYVLKGKTLVYVQYVSFGNVDEAAVKDAAVDLTSAVIERI